MKLYILQSFSTILFNPYVKFTNFNNILFHSFIITVNPNQAYANSITCLIDINGFDNKESYIPTI